MNAPVKALGLGRDVCWGARIEGLAPYTGGGWRLSGEGAPEPGAR